MLGPLPMRILFTTVKNTEFLSSVNTNSYYFRQYDIRFLALNVKGKQKSLDCLQLGTDHEKTSVMGLMKLFEVSGIHHSNSGLQITRDMYINDYFMLLFDETPDRGASEGYISHLNYATITVKLKFSKVLPEPITCIFYLEFDHSILNHKSINVSRDFKKLFRRR